MQTFAYADAVKAPMQPILRAIVEEDKPALEQFLLSDSLLPQETLRESHFVAEILHWFYAGDTLLHVAAAAHHPSITTLLLRAGADPMAAASRRKAQPLHYACDGRVNGPMWSSARQVKTIVVLLNAGVPLDAKDANGATALHRAVRTRAAAAVRRLLEAGADFRLRNHSGSTPFHLAVQNTGRGGSGSKDSIKAQREIINTFLEKGCSPTTRDGQGKSVLQSARSEWVRELLQSSTSRN